MCHQLEVGVIIISTAIAPGIFQASVGLFAIPQAGVDQSTGRSSKSTEEVHGIRSRPLRHRVILQGGFIQGILWSHDLGNVISCSSVIPRSRVHRRVGLGVHDVVEVHDGVDNPAESQCTKVYIGIGPERGVERP